MPTLYPARLYRSPRVLADDGARCPLAVVVAALVDWEQVIDADPPTIRAWVSDEQHALLLAEPGVEHLGAADG